MRAELTEKLRKEVVGILGTHKAFFKPFTSFQLRAVQQQGVDESSHRHVGRRQPPRLRLVSHRRQPDRGHQGSLERNRPRR